MAELKLGNIKPVGADNIVVQGKYVKGGYLVVADTTERDALLTEGQETIIEGSLCYCQADDKFYKYAGSIWVDCLYTKAEIDTLLASKQDTINDLDTIRSGATAGSTALQPNTVITGSTKTKITYDSNGLVTNGEDLTANDIPPLDTDKIITGTFADERIASASTWNAKQDKLTAGDNITIDTNNKINATDTKYTAGTNITITDNQISATDTTYTAGTNVQINNNQISATDTTYTGSTSIEIDSDNAISVKESYVALKSDLPEGELSINFNDATTTGTTPATLSNILVGTTKYTVPTYESKPAAESGTDVSLVSTGEKYTWNNKQNALPDTTGQAGKALIVDTEGGFTYGEAGNVDDVRVDGTSVVTNKVANIDLASKVDRTQTIAGVDLQDNITKAELLTALNVTEGATKVESSTTNGNIKINGTETTVYSDTTLSEKVTTLEAAVGDSNSGLVKGLADEITNRTSADSALSTRISNLESRGRYLSTWNASTGKPDSYPTPDSYPYTYTFKSGDYYLVSSANISGTKYKPSGTEISKQSASSEWVVGSAEETSSISNGDTYTYDGTNWTLLHNEFTDTNQTVKVGSTTFDGNAVVNFIGSGATTITADNTSGVNSITINTTYNDATTTTSGLMSSVDKSKLDGIESSADVNVLEGVQINGADLDITDKKVNLKTNTAYDATSNKIATMSDLPQGETSVTFNGTATTDTETLSNIVVDDKTYTMPTIPTVNDGILTIKRNSNTLDTFTANSASNVTVDIFVPTTTNELTNDSGFITKSVNDLTNYTKTSDLSDVATSGDYDDLSNKPKYNGSEITSSISIPEVKTATWDGKQDKLTATGSATNPVYVSADGTVSACTYELNKTVPSDAVFTDTTYTQGTGIEIDSLNNNAISVDESYVALKDDLPEGDLDVNFNGSTTGTSSTNALTNIVVGTSNYTIPQGTVFGALKNGASAFISAGVLDIGDVVTTIGGSRGGITLDSDSLSISTNKLQVADTLKNTISEHTTSISTINSTLDNKENTSNKVTTLSSSSTDTQYPSAKVTYDTINSAKQVYVCTYSTTTYAEITTALNSDKLPICYYNDNMYVYQWAASNTYWFVNYTSSSGTYGANFIYVNSTGWNTSSRINLQSALDSQTTYSAKGSSTKVPQITTNALGQVTNITEVDVQDTTYSAGNGLNLTGTSFAVDSTVVALQDDLPEGELSINFNGTATASTTSLTNIVAGTNTYTVPQGTITGITMNGTSKGTSGTVDLGTVLTAHQSLSDLGITATASEINVLDGVTASTTELNYVVGVTSNVQTQLNSKQSTSNITQSITSTSTTAQYPSAAATYEAIQDVREVAEGKSKNRVLSYSDTSLDTSTYDYYSASGNIIADPTSYISGFTNGNSGFNSTSTIITIATTSYLLIKGTDLTVSSSKSGAYYIVKGTELSTFFKVGDNVYVTQTDVADRWYYGTVYFSALETVKAPIQTISVNGTPQTIISSNVNLTVDTTYDSTSSNPQSGTAVASAISTKQNTLTQGTGITISSDTISINSNTVALKDDLPTGTLDVTFNGSTSSVTSTSALSNIVVGTSNYTIPSDLFECTYETTTYSEITTALSASKLPVCRYDDKVYVYQQKDSSGNYVFTCDNHNVDNLLRHLMVVSSSSTWITTSANLQKKLADSNYATISSSITNIAVEYKNTSGASQGALKFVKCTQAEYDALSTVDSNTFYIIVG